MKQKRYNKPSSFRYFLLLIFVLLSYTQCLASNGCYWEGMTRTDFVSTNMEGHNRGEVTDKIIYLTKHPFWVDDQVGALQYKSTVDFRANFHIHLHCFINSDSSKDSWAFDGIAINFGKNQVYTTGIGELIGYGGIQNAFVVELDYHLNENRNDPNNYHMSLHSCIGNNECTPDENLLTKVLPSHYEYNQNDDKELSIDVIHEYESHTIRVKMSDAESFILEYSAEDLPFRFNGEAKLGFSSFIRGRKRDIIIKGETYNGKIMTSYLCENGPTNIRPQMYVKLNDNIIATGNTNEIYEFQAGADLYIQLTFKDERSRELHNKYTISFSDSESSIGQDIPNGNIVQYKFYQPKLVGNYSITFSDKYGEDIIINYKIIPGTFNKLYYYGYINGVEDTSKSGLITIEDKLYFRWGSLQDKRFLINDFANNNGFFVAYFEPKDIYDNVIQTVPETETTQLQTLFNIDVQGPGVVPQVVVDKYDEGIYALKINVNVSGTFTISSQSIDIGTNIYFEVLSGTPSIKSFCSIGHSSTPTLRDGENIDYTCKLVDEWGLTIDPQQGLNEFGLSYICKLYRENIEYETIESVIIGEEIKCSYTTSVNGQFQFVAFWISGDNATEITSSMSIFNVIPEPKSILNTRIYDFSSNNWYHAKEIKEMENSLDIIKTSDDGVIIAIDFLDIDNKSFSEIGYNNFNISKLSGRVASIHEPSYNEADTKQQLSDLNEQKVIKLNVDNFEKVFTLSSFYYMLTLSYRNEVLTLKYITPLDKIGTYTTCHHPLSESNTELVLASNNIVSKVDTLITIGSIILRTDCSYLHNYFLTENEYSEFNFNINPLNSNTEIYIEKDSNVNGIYNLNMKSTIANTYTVSISFHDTPITNNQFTCNIHPLEIAAIIEANETNEYSEVDNVNNIYTLKDIVTADETPRLYFIAKDKFENILSYEPSSSNQNLHLSISLYIDDVIDTSSSNLIKYDKEKAYYYIEDNSKKAGTYTLTLTATSTNNEITFKYTKHPGAVSINKSIVTVINTKQIKSNSTSKVLIDLLDEYNNNIAFVDELFTYALNNLTVTAYSNDNTNSIIYSCEKYEGHLSVICTSPSISNVNTYIVQGKHDNKEIIACNSCIFDVVYSLFDIQNSVVKAIVKSSVITMSENNALNVIVDETLITSPPMFQLELRTTSGELAENVDKFVNITFELKNTNNEDEYDLEYEWVTDNIKLYVFEDGVNVFEFNGKYKLNVYYNDEIEKEFDVIFIKNENDYDDTNDISNNNLFISNEEIYVTAGEVYQFAIEFRTINDLRYTKEDINVDNIELNISIQDQYFKAKCIQGVLPGQVIIEIVLSVSTTFGNPNIITISYNSQIFTHTIKAIVSNGNLHSLKLTSEDIDTSITDQDVILTSITTEEVKRAVFVPYDKYNNIKKDIFNDIEQMQSHIKQVISLTHTDNNSPISYTISYDISKYEIILNIQSFHIGNVFLYSQYFNDIDTLTYSIPITPGQPSSKSIGLISKEQANINAGIAIELQLYVKDLYGNSINDVTIDTIKNEFSTKISLIDNANNISFNISEPIKKDEYFVYEITLYTKGKNIIEVYHNNVAIEVKYNVINVQCDNSEISIEKSVIIYDGKTYSKDDVLQFNKAMLPLMYMKFFDKYGNEYELNEMFTDIDIVFNNDNSLFCSAQYNNEVKLYLCDTTSWKSISPLTNIPLSFVFYMSNTQTYAITYNANIDSKEDSNISTESTIDISKTIISVSTITLTAGIQYQFSFETRTSDNKRPNMFLTESEIQSRIMVSFTKNKESFTYEITPGLHYGEYIVTLSSKLSCSAEDENYLMISIDSNPLNNIHVIVNPNNAVYGYFVNSSNEKISTLEDANCDNVYVLRAFLYDKYNNTAYDITSNNFNYRITYLENSFTIESSLKMNNDFSFSFAIHPIYAGTYQIDSTYWNEGDYTFNAIAGDIDAEKSYIGSESSTAIAGEIKKVFIVPYDKNGNYITPTNVDGFIMYRHVNINGEYSEITNSVIEDIEIDDGEGNKKTIKAIVYNVQFITSGDNIMSGIYGDKNLKCVQCVVNVSPADISLPNCDLYKYSIDANAFVKLSTSVKEIEYNKKTSPLYRLYPKDQYNNIIPLINESILSQLTAKLKLTDGSNEQTLTLQLNEDKTYFIITLSNEDYSNLSYGIYMIIITDSSSKELSFQLVLMGNAQEDSTITRSPLDEANTYILYKDLSFTAGEGGYIILQLRNEHNLPFINDVHSTSIELSTCDPSKDTSFTYKTISPSLSNLVYIKVNSTYSNTYPIHTECDLLLTVNSAIPPSSEGTLLMEVSPSILNSSYVIETYLKTTYELLDTNADIDLVFKLNVIDKYRNIAKAAPSDVKLTIKSETNEMIASSLITTFTEINTGYIKYSVPLYKVGTYTLTAGTNVNGDDLFEHSYTVYNSHGDIDMTKSSIIIKNKVLEAGKEATMVITPYDKNSNAIPPNEVIDYFIVNVTAIPTELPIQTNKVINEAQNAIEFIGTLTCKGDNTWHVFVNVNEIDCYGCITDVYPTKCDPSHTLVYFLNANSNYESASNSTTTLYSHIDNPLSMYLSFRDVYNNDIDSIDSTISVKDPTMSGNYMDEIVFEAKVSPDNSKIRINLPSDEAVVYKFNHLVQRENYKFELKVKVQDDVEEKEDLFKFNLAHYTKKNDTLYGNGIYVCMNTVINKESITIRAGESSTLNIKLYTEHNEMYNDDINLNTDIKITNPQDDDSFISTLSKQGQDYANYNLQITSNKKTVPETTFEISIKDYNTQAFEVVATIKLIVLIGNPDPEHTQIKTNFGDEIDEDINILLSFSIYDKFKNKFEGTDIINNLSIRNRGITIQSNIIYLESQDNNYQASFYPIYPPREMSINIYYNDGIYESNLLINSINTTVNSKVNWKSTQIISNNAYYLIAGDLLEMQLKLFDTSGICMDTVEEGVSITIDIEGPLEEVDKVQTYSYSFKQQGPTDEVCSMYFELVIDDEANFYTTSGTYVLTINANTTTEVKLIRKITQSVVPNVIDINNFIMNYNYKDVTGYDIEIPTNVIAGEFIPFIIRARDKYNNRVQSSFINNFEIEFREKDISLDKMNYTLSKVETTPGNVEYLLSIYKKGVYDIYAKYQDEEAKINIYEGPTSISIIAGSCSYEHPKVNEEGIANIMTSIEASFELICLDYYKNELSKGGESSSFDVKINLNVSNSITVIKNQLIDNEDGSYMCKFIPPLEGIYTIKVLLNNNEYFTKSIQVNSTNCGDDTPILCPNTLQCVSNILDCIPDRGKCIDDDTKPFECLVNGASTCVSSQNECDCPTNYVRCGYMNVCVPKEDMCSFSLWVNCNQYGSGLEFCEDGICRISTDLSPNQRVCPIGFVLCGDLTCRTSYDQCHVYDDCDVTEIRCNDMSCVSDQKLCPSTVSCNDLSKKVCPDGTCVDNEWECDISSCSEENPIRCSDNSCVKDIENCPKSVACGHGYALCTDFICREDC